MSQVFCAPRFHPLLIPAGLTFPFSHKAARKLLGEVVDEDGQTLDVDVTQWHGYRLEWGMNRSAFWVDDALVFESRLSPRPPLGVIIWIDNQYAAFTPEGKVAFGVLTGTEESIEIVDLEIETPPLSAAQENPSETTRL